MSPGSDYVKQKSLQPNDQARCSRDFLRIIRSFT